MAEISLEDAANLSQNGVNSPASTSISLSSAQVTGQSNPIAYTPPPEEPKPILERLARGFTKSVESAPQVIGQGLYFLGSHFNPGATPEEQSTGGSFGDRLSQLGIAMTERNQKEIAEKYPEQPDIWENVGGAIPRVGALALGSMTGFSEAAAATMAIGGGTQVGLDAFSHLRAQGRTTAQADALAGIVGAGAGSAMAFGIGNFLKATGPALTQVAKGIINGYAGGALQSGVTGSLQMATGVEHFEGMDSLKKLMIDAHNTGVTFAILGGPLGVHQAFIQHAALESGYQKMGLSAKEARDAAVKTMNSGMHIGISSLENTIKMTKDETGRIRPIPLLKPKLLDETGSPRYDALDEPYVPREPDKAEALTAEMDAQLRQLKLIKRDMADLREALAANKADQEDIQDPLTVSARKNLEKLREESEQIKENINKLEAKLQPRSTPIQDLTKQISKLKIGYREGKAVSKGEIQFVQKEFNNLIDSSDLDLNDKAKFRKVLPNIVSEESFFKYLPEVSNKITFLEDRAQQKTWRDELLKLSLKSLPADHKDIFDQVLSEKNFKFTTGEPILKTERLRNFFAQELGKGEPGFLNETKQIQLTPGELQSLDVMKNKSWADMDHGEKANAYQIIKTIYTNGVNENRFLSDMKAQKFDEFKRDLLNKIYNGEVPNENDREYHRQQNRELNKDFWKKLTDFHQSYRRKQVIPYYLMEPLHLDNLHQALHEAVADRVNRQVEGKKLLQETFKDLNQKQLSDIFKKRVELDLKVGEKVIKYTGDEAFRGNSLLDIYAHSFNDKGRAHLDQTFTQGDLDEILKYVQKEYPEATSAIQQRFKYMDGKGYSEVNEVHRLMTGANMPKEPFYNPIRYLAHASGKQLEMDMAMGVKGMMGRASTNDGFTRGRVESNLAFKKFDYFGNQIRNVMDRANYIALGPTIRDANKILYDREISQAISDTAGDEVLKMLRDSVRDIAFDGHKMDHSYDNLLRALRFSFSVGKIAYNPLSASKVFTQLSPASNYVGGAWVTNGFKDYMFDRKTLDKFIDSRSPFLKNRYFMQEREFVERFLRNGGNPLLTREEDFLKTAMWMHQEADRIVTRATWLGQYNKTMAENYVAGFTDEKSAIYAADLATALTHPTGGDLYLPDMFRGNEALKWFTMFKKAINTNSNLLMKANRDYQFGEKDLYKLAGRYIGVAVIPSLFLAALSLRRLPDKKEFGEEVLNNTIGTDIGAGYLTQAIALNQRNITPATPVTAALGDMHHAMFRQEPLFSVQKHDKLQDILSVADDFRGYGLANIYRLGTGKMFKVRGEKGSKGDSNNSNPFRAGGI